MLKLAVSLLLCLASLCYGSIDLSTFSNKATLKTDVYDLYWNISGDSIVMALHVATTGWVGFAIGEQTSGSMPGADFVTGWVDDTTSVASVQDRYTFDYVMPSLDACQDWTLIDSDQSDGTTTLVVSRLLVTNDLQDRPITAGLLRVLYAYGGADEFAYHGPNNRSEAGVEFIPLPDYDSSESTDETVYTYELLMNHSQIPAQMTTYYCQTFELPEVDDGQIIQIDPVVEINANASNLVHHFLAYACYTNASNWNTNPYPQTCDSIPQSCTSLFYVWAVGVGNFVLPKQAGFRIGKATSYAFRYLYIQVHYNNINSLHGLVDNSGIRVHYTTTASRPYDAGIMNMGDVFITFPDLPPQQASIALESECPSQCTSKFPHEITVFADFLHMHHQGSSMYNTHWTSNGSMVIENRVDFWDFGLQNSKLVNYTISPGDSMHVHCTYQTMDQTSTVFFGPASFNEMCLNYLAYYPIMITPYGVWDSCGNYKYNGHQITVCGSVSDPNPAIVPLLYNPPNPDPPGAGVLLYGTPCGSAPPTINPSVASVATVGTGGSLTAGDSTTGSHKNGAALLSTCFVALMFWTLAMSL